MNKVRYLTVHKIIFDVATAGRNSLLIESSWPRQECWDNIMYIHVLYLLSAHIVCLCKEIASTSGLFVAQGYFG